MFRTRAQRHIALLAGRAAEVKGELLDSDNDLVRDRASTHILGTSGIGPSTEAALAVSVNIRAGWVIDLSGRHDDTATVPTIPDNQAGVVIEHE
jgi:hypothetical protein